MLQIVNIRLTSVVAILTTIALPHCAFGQAPKPTVSAVTNVASYGNGPISPGEMVVIFGSGMGPSSVAGLQLDQQGRVANTHFASPSVVRWESRPADLRVGNADFCDGSLRSRREVYHANSGRVSGQYVRIVPETDCSVSAGDFHGRFFRPRSGGDDEFGRLVQHGCESGRLPAHTSRST